MFTLVISPSGGSVRVSEHDTLRDARAALVRFQARRGLWFTVARWIERDGVAIQRGELMLGGDIVGRWAIDYPVAELAENSLPVGIDTYAVSV